MSYGVGLVGLGEISSYFVKGVELNERTRLVAVCKRNKTAKEAQAYASVPFYTRWRDLVDDPAVQVVIIATPPSSHAEITDYALQKKKKVIVEKPYSLKLEDAHKSIQTAQAHGTHLYFAYHAAFNPLSLKARQRIHSLLSQGEKISTFKVIFREDVRNYHGANSWIFEPHIAGGGCLIDSGVNALSVVEHIGVGHVIPTKVSLGFNSQWKVEVSAKVQFVSASDPTLTGELDQDWLHTGPEKREIIVTFRSGKQVVFDYASGLITTLDGHGGSQVENVNLRESSDHHQTPMALEYIGIVNDAILAFDKKEVIDPLGAGPFKTVMQAYELYNKQAKL
eukprot:TRINITY_DN27873_c0_g1_i1.p1 TRINITY_DN27873_c0_g1~~TRINITY_DN27873_c0_g1_i1.p1  ORF type:complete len:337 (-),score=74.49 TRINITY_DN27873_c0_g1_i1:1-1011(-)